MDVGNFLRFKSCMLYTELENPDEPLINVEVVAHVTRPEFQCSEVSFFFFAGGFRMDMKIKIFPFLVLQLHLNHNLTFGVDIIYSPK